MTASVNTKLSEPYFNLQFRLLKYTTSFISISFDGSKVYENLTFSKPRLFNYFNDMFKYIRKNINLSYTSARGMIPWNIPKLFIRPKNITSNLGIRQVGASG